MKNATNTTHIKVTRHEQPTNTKRYAMRRRSTRFPKRDTRKKVKDHTLPLLNLKDESEDDYDSDYSAYTCQFENWDENVYTNRKQLQVEEHNRHCEKSKKKAIIKVKSTGARHPFATRQKYPSSKSSLNISTVIPFNSSLESDNSPSNQSHTSHSSVRIIYSGHDWKKKNSNSKLQSGWTNNENISVIEEPLVGVQVKDYKNEWFQSKPIIKSSPKNARSIPISTVSFKTQNHVFNQHSEYSSAMDEENENVSYDELNYEMEDEMSYHDHIGEVVASKLKETKSSGKKKKSKKHSMPESDNRKTSKSSGNLLCPNEDKNYSEYEEAIQNMKAIPDEKEKSKLTHFLQSRRDTSPVTRIVKEKSHLSNDFNELNVTGVAPKSPVSSAKTIHCSTNKEKPKEALKESLQRRNENTLTLESETGLGFASNMERNQLNEMNTVEPIDTEDNIFTSICLLSLGESNSKSTAPSRLKHGFVISGQQHCVCEENQGSIIFEDILRLENTENDSIDINLWRAKLAIDNKNNHVGQKLAQSQPFLRKQDMQQKLVRLLKSGNFDEALMMLTEFIHTKKVQIGIASWINVGLIQLWCKNYSDAVISFKNASEDMEEIASRESRRLALLGMALYGDAKFEDANQAYLRALTILRTKKQGYGCYNNRHDFSMGQIFNAVGCSFFETNFHKSSSRSFLNALHVYLQGVFDGPLTAEESQSVEFLLNKVKQNADWMTSIPQQFVHDTAVTFANLAQVLLNRKSLALAVSCLRLSLKIQMSLREATVDRHIMIAILEILGKTYLNQQKLNDAQQVFGIILRTGQEKFKSPKIYHEAMFRAAVVMQKLKAIEEDEASSMKFTDMAKYHRTAAADAVKVKTFCNEVLTTQKQEEVIREEEQGEARKKKVDFLHKALSPRSSDSHSVSSCDSSCLELQHSLSIE